MSFFEVPLVLGEEAAVGGEAAEALAPVEELATEAEPIEREPFEDDEDEGKQKQSQVSVQNDERGISVQLLGADRVVRHLDELSSRLRNPGPALAGQVRRLESMESELFGELGGRYVRTGALRASLTQPSAPGGIRKVTGEQLEFGTSVGYASFQVQNPGPQTERGGLRRKGHPSAVLRLDQRTAHEIAEDVGARLMGRKR